MDPVIEAYKRDVDRTMLIENLKLTPDQRSQKFRHAMKLVFELMRSAQQRRDERRLDEHRLDERGERQGDQKPSDQA